MQAIPPANMDIIFQGQIIYWWVEVCVAGGGGEDFLHITILIMFFLKHLINVWETVFISFHISKRVVMRVLDWFILLDNVLQWRETWNGREK